MTAYLFALQFITEMDRRIRYGKVYDTDGHRICCLGQLVAAIEAGKWGNGV